VNPLIKRLLVNVPKYLDYITTWKYSGAIQHKRSIEVKLEVYKVENAFAAPRSLRFMYS
jgi:hypothetical protein